MPAVLNITIHVPKQKFLPNFNVHCQGCSTNYAFLAFLQAFISDPQNHNCKKNYIVP